MNARVLAFFSALMALSSTAGLRQEPPEPTTALIAALDDPSTAWAATTRLARAGSDVVPMLLTGGPSLLGPHGGLSARGLALAKRGPSVIPDIARRLRALADETRLDERVDASALIAVLTALGAPAVPALVAAAEHSRDAAVRATALDAIVRLEPGTKVFGQMLSAWHTWHPADDRLRRLERAITPLLPGIERIMERDAAAWIAERTAPHRPAAYLLARWARGEMRARGLAALTALARAESEYGDWTSAALLVRVDAASAADVLRDLGSRRAGPENMREQRLLRIAVALHQLGMSDYLQWLDAPLSSSSPDVVTAALEFVGRSGNLRLTDRAIALLSDMTPAGGERVETIDGKTVRTRRRVRDAALDALRRLTFQDLPSDQARWLVWARGSAGATQSTLLHAWLARRMPRVATAPIWEVNAWIGSLSHVRDPQILPLIDAYLRRDDLDPSRTGPHSGSVSGGSGPAGVHGPAVVTLLLEGARADVPGFWHACDRASRRPSREFGCSARWRCRRSTGGVAWSSSHGKPQPRNHGTVIERVSSCCNSATRVASRRHSTGSTGTQRPPVNWHVAISGGTPSSRCRATPLTPAFVRLSPRDGGGGGARIGLPFASGSRRRRWTVRPSIGFRPCRFVAARSCRLVSRTCSVVPAFTAPLRFCRPDECPGSAPRAPGV